MNKYIMNLRMSKIAMLIYISLSSLSCKKMLEVDLPIASYAKKEVFETTPTAVTAMNGIYVLLSTPFYGTSYTPASLSDDLSDPNVSGDLYFTNGYKSSDDITLWSYNYQYIIYNVNSLIEGLSASKTLPESTKSILLGEAKFVRAYIYFYLINYFGDAPLVLTTDFKANSNIPRTNKTLIYDQIIKDLKEAEADLSENYFDKDLAGISQDRVRPNKFAATALLARVYLFRQNWQEAEIESSKLIDGNSNFSLVALNEVFLKNSREAIWQLQPPKTNEGTNDPETRNILSWFGIPDFHMFGLSQDLVNAFEPEDQRKLIWVQESPSGSGFFIPYKYKVGAGDINQPQIEYTMVLRLSEQYLIRAEARAHLDITTGDNSAASDLNVVRNRAGLPEYLPTSKDGLLNAILRERRVELFTEQGHRWFDLKRTNHVDEVMNQATPIKGGSWETYKSLLPIPAKEFDLNPALRGHQNPGYSEK